MHWVTSEVNMLPQAQAVSLNALRNYQLMVCIHLSGLCCENLLELIAK
jgi:hypothetical protein